MKTLQARLQEIKQELQTSQLLSVKLGATFYEELIQLATQQGIALRFNSLDLDGRNRPSMAYWDKANCRDTIDSFLKDG